MKKYCFLILSIFVLSIFVSDVISAEKRSKRTPAKVVPQKEPVTINDGNVEINLKKAEDLLKKEDYSRASEICEVVYEFSKNVLKVVEIVDEKQKQALEGRSLDQRSKELLMWKAKRRENLKSRYSEYLARSAYCLGYINAQKNDMESAGKYLIDAIKNAPVSDKPDSLYLKSLNLLAKLYSLEGEL
ncbi:MAG: hypothetical protein N2513_09060 [Deltaproteobacteria bacterium]|nr:hypothetical protein [Deltaproteobacteria bacterium]